MMERKTRKIILRGTAAVGLIAAGAVAMWILTSDATRQEELAYAAEKYFGKEAPRNRVYTRERRALTADRDEVYRIVTPDSDSEGERLKLVHALPKVLTENDRRLIYDYIRTGPGGNTGDAIKNDLMNKLRNQSMLPPELTGELMSMVRERKLPRVVRIYALQHLRPQYEETWDPAIRELFWEALEESDTEIAGGALLALRYLGTEYPGDFDLTRVRIRAAELAANAATNELTRISALQVSAQLRGTESLESARALAKSEATPPMLRLSAVAALGEIGTPEDRELLSSLERGEKNYCRPAAKLALKKLNQRAQSL